MPHTETPLNPSTFIVLFLFFFVIASFGHFLSKWVSFKTHDNKLGVFHLI